MKNSMKKGIGRVIFVLTASVCIAGCGLAGRAQTVTQREAVSKTDESYMQPLTMSQNQKEENTSKKSSNSQKKLPRMVMAEDKLYVDTGETNNSSGRCGVMDGKITSTVKANKTPKKNGQSNFGKGYGYQYSFRKGRIEIFIDDSWHVFAHNENNLDGVAMEVVKSTPSRAVLRITNTTDLKIEYGEDYSLEVLDKKNGEWSQVSTKVDNYGFDSIAYQAPKNRPVTYKLNWRTLYGKQKPGTYRIIKPFLDFRSTGDYTEYTIMAEFQIKR